MDILAKIKGIKYNPLLCRNLEVFAYKDLERALASCASFILNITKENKVAISWWVSAKRTRSYPYTRVYDTLGFSGKKITIIPVIKDEGKEGDRDFLQWDTKEAKDIDTKLQTSDLIPSTFKDKLKIFFPINQTPYIGILLMLIKLAKLGKKRWNLTLKSLKN
ncbi:MAG: hypothetical protein UT57_C0062G0005 [Microgenomates group bacterium GW2011_GWC1_39_7]|nr:MAG: hypothetical protein UT57_C0062G0005 [Microgenomates group bacterium GW2011_GWC1_39_7]